MKTLLKLLILYLLMVILPRHLQAQDAYFSQFYANPVFLNPAFAGSTGQSRAVIAHRRQWAQLSAYTTTSFSYDMPLGESSGMALQALNDIQMDGVIKNAKAGISLSHRLVLNRNQMIGFGLSANYFQKRFDWSNLVFEDQMRSGSNNAYPTEERFGNANNSLFDLGIGAIFSSNNLLAGININHINRPKERFNPESQNAIPVRYTLHAAYTFQQYFFGRKSFNITPSVIYEKQGASDYLNVGAYWSNDILTLGSWYRVNQAMVFTAGLSFNQLGLGYSYDYFLSEANTNFGATNEFTLSYTFSFKQKEKRKYLGKCPDIYKQLK